MERHQSIRVRHETRRRTLTVSSIDRITQRMLSLGFTSGDLQDFVSASPDDHIKLFFPSGVAEGAKPCMRDFTPRRVDIERGSLTVDFALHEAGPATRWAAAARLGDTLEIGGPRGSVILPDDFDWYLLIGDETAVPAIGRRVEELRAGVPVTTFVVAGKGEAQSFETAARWTPHWIERPPGSDDATLLKAALATHELPPGEGFVWIAAEAAVARSLRTYMIDDRKHPREWSRAAGYWKRGEADAHEKIED
jgi:NADPH-dependent ferric siderophore reductase